MNILRIARLLGLSSLLTVAGALASRELPKAPAAQLVNIPADASSEIVTASDGRIQVFVELTEPAAAVKYAAALADKKASPSQAKKNAIAAGKAQVAKNRSQHARVAAGLQKLHTREIYRAARVLNGISVFADRADLDRIAQIPEVKRIIPIYREYPTSAQSVPFIGAPNVWANTIGLPSGVTGTGVRVGIIDTGIDYIHADFGGTGVLADYQNDSTATTNFTTLGGLFPTAKVVGGTDLVGDAYTGSNLPVPDPNPMDCNGHGSHVAGTAAGVGVNADGTTFAGPYDASATTYLPLRIVPGVAPGALLYAIRVFGCGGSTGVTVQAIDWAMDPNGDNDLSDHLDVINMSLGSNYGTATSASALAADNASLAGVVVVMSAGNSGDSFFINGSPGVSTRGIAIAASLDSGEPFESVMVNSPAGVAGSYFGGSAAFGPAPSGQTANGVLAASVSGVASQACGALTNAAAVAGNICVADRGTCSFKTKTLNCQNAGAIGVIIANNAPGSPPPGMADDATIVTPITIPTEMVSLVDGNTIKANLAAPLNATLNSAGGGDTLASFSSRGPRHIYGSALRVKPDISAPGLNITSVQTGHTCNGTTTTGCTGVSDPSGFDAGNNALIISGTSMASPHVAGVMALLRQLKPDWSVEELKALAMNYAVNDVTEFPNATPPRYPASRVGAGRVDPAKAAVSDVVVMNADDTGLVSVTFDPEIVGIVNQVKKIRVINKGSSPQTFDLAFDDVLAAPGVAFSLPGGNQVTVPAGGVAELNIQMSADSTLTDHTRDPSLFATQGVQANYGDQPRNYLTEKSSYLTFSQSSSVKFRLPVYMAEKPASTMSGPDTIVTGGAPTGSTTIALSGNDLCTGTLAAGPTCTGTFPNDVESLVSPFELQVVNPLNPTLPNFANIHYVGSSYLQAGGAPSITNDLMMFGVASWGDWATPNDVSYAVCVDTNSDGVYDRILYNTNPSVFVANASPNDNYVRVVQNASTAGYSILGLGSPVNVVGPDVIDSALQVNNVMILAASPATLGIASTATTSVKYKVVTCSGVGCARTTTGDHCSPTAGNFLDQVTGPFTFNWGAKGLDFHGDFLDEDLNGKSLSVDWNTANMTANGSVGALLLHHQNKAGTRAEVVVLDSAAHADLAVTQSVAPPTPVIGGNVTFTVTVTNNGPSDATGVVVNEALPAGANYVSDDGGGAYDSTSGQWTVGALANGASATLNVTATVLLSDPQCAVGQRADSTPLDTNSANDSATVCALAPHSADLKLGMVASGATVLVGNPLTYTITATNQGSDPAYSINVTDAFPAFPLLRPTSFVASQGVYDEVTGLWNFASLDVGKSATLAISLAAPNMAGALTEQATGSASTSDPNTADNIASATTTVLSPASITATMSATGPFVIGNNMTYTVVLSNSATYDQQDNPGHEFTVVLPSQLTLVSANATSGNAVATIGTNTVDWDGVVPASGSTTITITATIMGTVAPATVITVQGAANFDADGNGTNEAQALTDDPAIGGATDPTAFVALSPANVSATKTVSGTFLPGGTVTYTVTLTNSGVGMQGDYVGHEFVDLLPSELTLASAVATSGAATSSGNTVSWDGSIAVGGSVTITITATVNAGTYGQTISNQGIVFFDADGNGSNESSVLTDDPGVGGASDPTTFSVPATGALSGVGSASPSSVAPSGSTTLTVVVTPGTNPTSTNVHVTADLTSIGGSATQALSNGGSGNTYTYAATVSLATAPGNYSLPVTVVDDQSRSASATLALTVLTPGALSATASAAPNSGIAGATSTFAVNVTLGTNPASTGVHVTADLIDFGGTATQAFTDNSGGSFSFNATVQNSAAPGLHVIPVSITDGQGRNASASIAFNVPAPGALSGAGIAVPESVPLAGSATLLVAVTPGTSPASSGLTVTANLAQIGGDVAQAFHDDGLNGDATAGDNIYTFVAPIGSTIALGTKLLPVSIGDAQSRSGTATIQIDIIQGTEVIFANGFE